MLHVHVLLVAPLGACDMAQAGADEHQRGVAVGEGAHYTGAPADLVIKTLNDVVCADPRPVVPHGNASKCTMPSHSGIPLYLWSSGTDYRRKLFSCYAILQHGMYECISEGTVFLLQGPA